MRSTVKIIFQQLTGFLWFVIVLGLANFLAGLFGVEVLKNIVYFFNASILYLFFIMIVDLVSHIFWNFDFPFNLPAPIVSAFFGVLVVGLIINLAEVIGFIPQNLFVSLGSLVFVIVLVVGYIKIFALAVKKKEGEDEKFSWKVFRGEVRDEIDDALKKAHLRKDESVEKVELKKSSKKLKK